MAEEGGNPPIASLAGVLLNFKAVLLLFARCQKARQTLVESGDFVPPVRAQPTI